MMSRIPGTALSEADVRSRLAAVARPHRNSYLTSDRLSAILRWNYDDVVSGRYRILLYRFLARQIPAVSACIWTWAHLTAAPGRFVVTDSADESRARQALDRLERLEDSLYVNCLGARVGLTSLISQLAVTLFRDGAFGGFLTVSRSADAVDRFIPVDPARLGVNTDSDRARFTLDLENRSIDITRPDFYHIPLTENSSPPFGSSILQSVPFVTYIEQQMVSDMARVSHNSGYHRLHVKITPPERLTGESDKAYTDRINGYFDATVNMIRECDIDDNPVTWDNVEISFIGPDKSREVANSWFMTHRAMIEEICAGTNLAPFLLGYSYGATTTWSHFKFDIVMRQVRSIQQKIARFVEWIASVDLALAGLDVRVRYEFDNTFAYQAADRTKIQSSQADTILRLYEAGLIDPDTARDKACRLL